MNNKLLDIKKILLSQKEHDTFKNLTVLELDEIEKIKDNFSFVNEYLYRGYKGLNNVSNAIIDPSKRDRGGSLTGNNLLYNIINTFPSWKEYPKRNRSLCILNSQDPKKYIEVDYDSLYNIFPKKNSKIAVCPEHDLNYFDWPMIKNFESKIDIMNSRPEFFLRGVLHLGEYKYFSDQDYEGFLRNENNYIRKIEKNITEVSDSGMNDKEKYKEIDFFNYILSEIKKYGNLSSYLDKELFNPEKNGFMLINSNEKIPLDNVEVWTESECLLNIY
jgi:hypothetical protein